jgi:uncharacterized protein YcfL
MRKHTLVVISIMLFGLAGCHSKPSHSEIFRLRSDCTALGTKLFDKLRAEHPDMIIVVEGIHYNVKTNRCYALIHELSGQELYGLLYDAQTLEQLATTTSDSTSQLTGSVKDGKFMTGYESFDEANKFIKATVEAAEQSD